MCSVIKNRHIPGDKISFTLYAEINRNEKQSQCKLPEETSVKLFGRFLKSGRYNLKGLTISIIFMPMASYQNSLFRIHKKSRATPKK